jgi:hypothetical protein
MFFLYKCQKPFNFTKVYSTQYTMYCVLKSVTIHHVRTPGVETRLNSFYNPNNFIMSTKSKILEFIKQNEPVKPHDLLGIGINKVMIHRHLKNLIKEKQIIKKGSAPHVHYFYSTSPSTSSSTVNLPKDIVSFINQNYLYFSPTGNIQKGLEGFISWCHRRKQEIEQTAFDYKKTLAKYDAFKNKEGLIDGLVKFERTFEKVFVDQLFYFDFYSLERFGKTKLGSMLLYAKQDQNKFLMKEISKIIKKSVEQLIKTQEIQAVAYVPHSIKRSVQLLPEIKKMLNLKLPEINLFKVFGNVALAQKTLTKLSDRIENAKNTIFIKNNSKTYKKILLIDDAVGSGATFNEVAKKIKDKGVAKQITAIAITGSFKGFDVLTEI